MSLSDRAWKHIRERHPEVSRYRSVIEDTASSPEIIMEGRWGERKAIRYLNKTHLGPKYLVVVYAERSGRKAIITAYLTSDKKKVKGEIVWKA